MKNCGRSSRLILLTSKFPCATGEEFLESELEYVAKEFDEVLIVPTFLPPGDEAKVVTREIPSNCRTIFPVDAGDPRLSSVAVRWRSAARSPMVRCPLNAPQRWAIDMRFAVTALSLYERVLLALVEAGVRPEEPTLLYSYWLFKPAAVAVLLKQHFFSGDALAVSRGHGYDVYPSQGVLGYLPARPFLLENLDRIYPISDAGRESILQEASSREHTIQVQRLGVPDPPKTLQRAFDTPVTFVTCSSFAPVKRIDLIIDAFKLLAKDRVDVRWVHIGDSGEGSLEKFREQIATAGLSDRVTALGRLTNSEVLEFYAGTSVQFFVNFSSSEGVPVSVMEALSYSIPAIASDVGGTGEIVLNGRNGMLVDPDSGANGLAAALQQAASCSPDRYAELSRAAFDVFTERSRAASLYPEFSRTLRELVHGA